MSTPYKRTIQRIVIHHPGDGKPPGVSILSRWNPFKYEYPEYDFGVEENGTIRVGRPLNVQGAHCIGTKQAGKGGDWYNQNSIGIVVAGDFTLYPMGLTQFYALVSLVKRLMSEHGLTLDNVYPHCQVSSTVCPGATYSKVAGSRGKWSYDEFEKAIMAPAPAAVVTPVVVAPPAMYRVILDGVHVMALSDQAKAIAECMKAVAERGAYSVVVERTTDGVKVYEFVNRPAPIVIPPVIVPPAVVDNDDKAVDLLNQAIKILKEGK